jgi:exodeoxyribonuclease VII large subunit
MINLTRIFRENMPELIVDKKVFSLLEVAQSIRKTVADRYSSPFWVRAEMNKLNHYSYSGHCYPDLVEKSDGKVVAQLRANLWKSDYFQINENFLRILNEPLKDGINILFCATITFDAVHGLSLRIIDIDPVFSLGELEREKLETLEKLRRENIFDLNKNLEIVPVPQRIAVISVETSKGYADFINIIGNNPWGYKFFCFLFPALLQGDKSISSILGQLKRIKKVKDHFDVVVIVRGGGGDVGLSSYNNYTLAKEIAQFPLPVLTGIGHSTNETVAEMVAFRNAITPTELADYLLQRFHNFSVPVQRMQEILIERSKRILREENANFKSVTRYFRSVTTNALEGNNNEVNACMNTLFQYATFAVKKEKSTIRDIANDLVRSTNSLITQKKSLITGVEQVVTIMDPINILKRGFTITRMNGKAVKDLSNVKAGDNLVTLTAEGSIESIVTNSKRSEAL